MDLAGGSEKSTCKENGGGHQQHGTGSGPGAPWRHGQRRQGVANCVLAAHAVGRSGGCTPECHAARSLARPSGRIAPRWAGRRPHQAPRCSLPALPRNSRHGRDTSRTRAWHSCAWPRCHCTDRVPGSPAHRVGQQGNRPLRPRRAHRVQDDARRGARPIQSGDALDPPDLARGGRTGHRRPGCP